MNKNFFIIIIIILLLFFVNQISNNFILDLLQHIIKQIIFIGKYVIICIPSYLI